MNTERSDHLERLAARLPKPIRAGLTWLLRPGAKWLRVPLGALLVVGGLLGFLPILGFWMIPVGALLLAEDFPVVRKPTIRAINAVEAWWIRRRSAWR